MNYLRMILPPRLWSDQTMMLISLSMCLYEISSYQQLVLPTGAHAFYSSPPSG